MGHGTSEPLTRPSLLLRIRDPNDHASWQTFADVYGPLVYRTCRGKGLQHADAAEVTQEVFLQVSRSIHTLDYQPERGRFRAWLGTVTYNKLRNFLNRRPAEPGTGGAEEAVAVAVDPDWTDDFNEQVFQAALTRSRPHFEEPTWRAFEQVWLEHRPPAEVARELERPVAWVYLAKSRVLDRLRQEIRDLAEDLPLFAR
jgi:RNA polymerase sigma-70 factor (ECF subfamily)